MPRLFAVCLTLLVMAGCKTKTLEDIQGIHFTLLSSRKTNIHFDNRITESDSINVFDNEYMANLAQTINVLQAVILTDKEKMILTPTYHVLEMYNVHQNAALLPVTVTTGKYTLGNESLPAVSVSA